MKKYIFGFLTLFFALGNAQNINDHKNYLEDQIYLGLTYNVLTDLPNTVKQSGFSNSIFLGFIKDIPINERRNFGFGVGLGYSIDTYFHNIKNYSSK